MNVAQKESGELVSPTQKVNELIARFSEVQKSLKESMKAVDSVNKSELETGFFKSLTGKTDSEIAKHVKTLGLNLRTTQDVVLFLVELSHVKNEVLRGFYDNVVDKIIELDKEHENFSGDLNASQINERKIVNKIKEQIESQLAVAESIDANSSNIESNRETIIINDSKIIKNNSLIEGNKQTIEYNKQKIESNESALSEIHEAIKSKTDIDNEQSTTIVSNKIRIDKLEKQLTLLQDDLENKNSNGNKIFHVYGAIGISALLIALIGFIL